MYTTKRAVFLGRHPRVYLLCLPHLKTTLIGMGGFRMTHLGSRLDEGMTYTKTHTKMESKSKFKNKNNFLSLQNRKEKYTRIK